MPEPFTHLPVARGLEGLDAGHVGAGADQVGVGLELVGAARVAVQGDVAVTTGLQLSATGHFQRVNLIKRERVCGRTLFS